MKTPRFRLLAALAGLFSAAALPAAENARPNYLFIIFDDWGWRDAGAYGSTWVKR